MKTKLLILILLVFSGKLLAENVHDYEWGTYFSGSDDMFLYEPDAVKGPVAVRVLDIYSSWLKYGTFPTDINPVFRIHYFYNSKGKISSYILHAKSTSVYCLYTYSDVSGLLSNKKFFYFINGNLERTPYKEATYAYDEKKRVTTITYTYDDREEVSKHVIRYQYDKPGAVTLFEYGSSGEKLAQYQNYYTNKRLTKFTRQVFLFNRVVNNITANISYNQKGQVDRIFPNAKKGEPIKPINQRFYKYEYDKQGNWTYRLAYPAKTKNGDVASVENITYEWVRGSYVYANTPTEVEELAQKALMEEMAKIAQKDKAA